MRNLLERFVFLVCPTVTRRSLIDTIFRASTLLFLIVWSLPYFTLSVHDLGENWGWMHRVDLIFHEAGHAITAMLTQNRDWIVFMGSGLQVLFPLVVCISFYWCNGDGFSAALGLWWTGQAVLDVSPYIADSRALELMLLSGGTGKEVEGHDWEYLLTRWDALPLDLEIAARVAMIGRCVMLVAFLWAAANLIYDRFALSDAAESTDGLVTHQEG